MDTLLPAGLVDPEDGHTIDRRSGRSRPVEVIVRGERRRAWTVEQKREIVAESLEPGAALSEVARRHGIGSGLLYTWRRQMLTGAAAGALTRSSPNFLQVELSRPSGPETAEPLEMPPTPAAPSRMEGLIVLPGGVSLRVDAQVDGQALRRVLGALAER